MSLPTLSSIRTQAISYSDQTNSGFISVAEWALYINAEAASLYRRLKQADPDQFIVRNPDYILPLNTGWIRYTGANYPTKSFVVGETVTGGTSAAHGVVIAFPDQTVGDTAGALFLGAVVGTFKSGETLTGGTSAATATSSSVYNAASQYQPLPGDFWLIDRVDYIQSNVQPFVFQTILALNQMEEDAYQFTTLSFYGQGLRYRIQGQQLCFVPNPPVSGQIRLLYTPRPPTLVNDADTLEDLAGFVDSVAVGAAIRALVKENNLAAAAALRELKADVDKEFDRIAQATRDKSTPSTTAMIRGKNAGRGGYRNW